jgi:hypothetical protein
MALAVNEAGAGRMVTARFAKQLFIGGRSGEPMFGATDTALFAPDCTVSH